MLLLKIVVLFLVVHIHSSSSTIFVDRMCSSSPSSWLAKLVHAWKHLQPTYYGGKYSIHRLLALEDYTKHTSLIRVLLVCVGTPLPMVVFISIHALLPLQDPSEGWRVNYGFWIQSGILSFVVAHTLITQATYLIDGVYISLPRLILLSACASVIFTAFAIAISAVLIFPVPFFVLTLAPVFYVALAISHQIILGARTIRQMLQHRDQLILYITFVAVQNVMVVTYPAYETLFRIAKGSSYQLPVILLLPLIKVAVKNVVFRCMTSMEDMLPEAVIFTVDFFNSVYIATCVQSSSSSRAIIAITITDLFQTIIMLYGLHQRAATILRRCMDTNPECGNLLSALSSVCRDHKKFGRQARTNITFRSCLPLVLSAENKELLGRLQKIPTALSCDGDKSSSLLEFASSPNCIKAPDSNTERKTQRIFVKSAAT